MTIKKCNLLLITDTYIGWPGGSERHLYNFLSNVDSELFNITAVQMLCSGNVMLQEGVFEENSAVSFINRPLKSIRSIVGFKLIYELWRLIRDQDIKIIISYHEKSDILNFLVGLLPGITIMQVTSKRDLGFKQGKKLKFIMDIITPKLKHITAPSNSILEQMSTRYGKDSVYTHLIPNGVDLNQFNVASNDIKSSNRSKFKLPINKKIIGIIGSLSKVKGHEYLLQGFSKFIQNSKNDWHLVVVGEGSLDTELILLATELSLLNNVSFVGVQSNVSEWLSSLDLLVSTSLSEGLSNSLIEGAASGLPIIATNVGGNPEIVDDQYNGLLINPSDTVSLVDALKIFDKNPELLTSYGHNSRQKAEDCFSIISMVNKLECLYLEISKDA